MANVFKCTAVYFEYIDGVIHNNPNVMINIALVTINNANVSAYIGIVKTGDGFSKRITSNQVIF